MSQCSAKFSSVLAKTLEDLCFHMGSPTPMPSASDTMTRFARVPIAGHWQGDFVIGIQAPLLQEFAQSLLGEEEVSSDDSQQALLEIANVVCGNALPELESAAAVFTLEGPVACDGRQFDRPGVVPCFEGCLDQGAVVVRIFRDRIQA